MKKILIGCPTVAIKSYCLVEYVQAIQNLIIPEEYKIKIMLVDTSKGDSYYLRLCGILPGDSVIKNLDPQEFDRRNRDSIIDGRNMIRDFAIEHDYDYFFSLEQDVIPPRDALVKLLECSTSIVSGIYCYPSGDPILWGFSSKLGRMRKIRKQMIFDYGERVIEVCGAGLGVMLIHINVLKKIKFRYDAGKEAYDDHWFCEDAKAQGCIIMAHCGVRCDHIGHVYKDGQKYILGARW